MWKHFADREERRNQKLKTKKKVNHTYWGKWTQLQVVNLSSSKGKFTLFFPIGCRESLKWKIRQTPSGKEGIDNPIQHSNRINKGFNKGSLALDLQKTCNRLGAYLSLLWNPFLLWLFHGRLTLIWSDTLLSFAISAAAIAIVFFGFLGLGFLGLGSLWLLNWTER